VINVPFTAQIEGRTLGLVGYGKIGRAVARRAKPFGLAVTVYDPYLDSAALQADGVTALPLEELLATADFVSVHAPLNAQTRHLLDASRLALLKPSAYLVNTSRGGLIDEEALIDCLRRRSIAGAGLDVFEREPPGKDNPLFAMDNVIVTPHCAAHTAVAHDKVRRSTIEAVVRALRGERPLTVVNPEVLSQTA
jgi:phosphoglycerate dehydrogenase-like enzyme